MQKHKLLVGLVIVLVVIVGVLAACGTSEPETTPGAGEPPAAPIDGEALLQDRCASCHGLDLVEQAQKTEAEWTQTVERMVVKGARLNAEEKAALIEYLAETYK